MSMASPAQAKTQTVGDLRIQDVFRIKPELVWFLPTTKLSQALAEMTKQHVASAPVIANKGEANEKYHGMIDIIDILNKVIDSLDLPEDVNLDTTVSAEFFAKLAENMAKDLTHIPYTRKDICKGTDKVVDILKDVFFQHKFERITQFNDDNKVVGVISLSDILSHIDKYCSNPLGDVADRPMKDLGMLGENFVVLTCRVSDTMLGAYKKMSHQTHQEVAVCDNAGAICTFVSPNDLRVDLKDGWQHLLLRIGQVKTQAGYEPTNYGDSEQAGMVLPTTCHENTTVSQALDLLLKNRSHTVFVVNDNGSPTGMFRLSDMLKSILGQVPR